MTRTEHGMLTRRQFAARALAAGVSMTALPSLLAACSSDEDDSPGKTGTEKVTLTFWKFVSEGDDPTIAAAVKQWNAENPNTQVNFQTFPYADYNGTKLTTAFASGKGPDVFWISPGAFVNYVNNGVAAPVDDIVDKAAYSEAAVRAVSVGGKMHAVPFEQEPVALYYRKDHLEKAGIAPPTSWQALQAAAAELTSGNRKGIFVEPAPGPYQNFSWYPFLWSAGGEVVNADSTKSALRTPEAASAFDLWGQLVTKGHAPKRTEVGTFDIAPLGRGECSMQVCGFWALAPLKANFPKEIESVGIIPIPAPAGGKPVTVYGGWTQMVNSKGKHVEQAKAFTKWLWIQNNSFAEQWACRKGSKYSPRKAVNDACTDVFGGEPHSVFTNQILATARAEPRYPDQIVKAVGDGLQAAMFTGKSGEEAASLAADAIDKYLASYKGAPLNPEA
jgi:multiple sugar transport system substrate-binding protein